jgi:hypothetical protein
VRVFLLVSLLATGVARVAGGGLLYHGAGLSTSCSDHADVNGLVDDLSLADVRLVFGGRNPVVVVAWHELTHHNSLSIFVSRRLV